MKKKILFVFMLALVMCLAVISVSADAPHDTTRQVTLDNGQSVPLYDGDGEALTYYIDAEGKVVSAKTKNVISVNANGIASYNGIAVKDVVVANFQSAEIEALGIKEIPKYNISGYTYNEVIEYVFVPNSVVRFTHNQFRFTNKLKMVHVTRDSQITEFTGQFQFYYATALKEFYFPPKLKTTPTSVGDGSNGTAATFSHCTSLAYVGFYDNGELESFGKYCFTDCTSLESIDIPSSVTKLCEGVFSNTGLKELIIPNHITNVGPRIVQYCKNLVKLQYSANMGNIEQSSTYQAGNLQYIYVPNTVTIANGTHHFSLQHTQYKPSVMFFAGTEAEAQAFIKLIGNRNNEKFYTTDYGNFLEWDPSMTDEQYVAKAETDKKHYVVFGYDRCRAFYNGHNMSENAEMQFNGYFNDILFGSVCTNDGCSFSGIDESKTIPAMFEYKGYSCSEFADKNGCFAMTQGYKINKASVELYKEATKGDFIFGVLATGNSASTAFVPDLTASNVIVHEFKNLEHEHFEIKVTGLTTDYFAKRIVFCAYVIDNGKTLFLEGTPIIEDEKNR